MKMIWTEYTPVTVKITKLHKNANIQPDAEDQVHSQFSTVFSFVWTSQVSQTRPTTYVELTLAVCDVTLIITQ